VVGLWFGCYRYVQVPLGQHGLWQVSRGMWESVRQWGLGQQVKPGEHVLWGLERWVKGCRVDCQGMMCGRGARHAQALPSRLCLVQHQHSRGNSQQPLT
jgi:hypothetical protein